MISPFISQLKAPLLNGVKNQRSFHALGEIAQAFRHRNVQTHALFPQVMRLSTTMDFGPQPNPVLDQPVIHALLDSALSSRTGGYLALERITERIAEYSNNQVIELMNCETAPNYAGSFKTLVDGMEGPFYLERQDKQLNRPLSMPDIWLNGGMSYQAQKDCEGDGPQLTSRAVYTVPQLMGTLVANVYGRDAIKKPVKSLILNTGSEAMSAAIDGINRLGEHQSAHIIFHDHFHGRGPSFNNWDYTSYQFEKEGVTPLPFNDSNALASHVEAVLKHHPKRLIGIYFEPVQGEGGVTPLTQEFANTLIRLRSTYPQNIILVADNVQRGFAGEDLWGLKGIEPCMMAISKFVNNGDIAVGILLGKTELMDRAYAPGTHGGTHSLNRAVADSLIKWFGRFSGTDLLAQLQANCDDLNAHLGALASDHFRIKGDGSAMIGIEAKDKKTAAMIQHRFEQFRQIYNQLPAETRDALINKHFNELSGKQKEEALSILSRLKGGLFKIAADGVTIRASGARMREVSYQPIKLMYEVVLQFDHSPK